MSGSENVNSVQAALSVVPRFRSAESLAAWVKFALLAQAALAVAGVWTGYLENQVLVALRDGLFESDKTIMAAAEASDARRGLVSILQLILFVVVGFLTLRWIHRSNANARALGAQEMVYSPGWSIGWYFVPIANLWKPFQAMSEIWRASSQPLGWQSLDAPPLLGVWWLLWVINGFVGNISFRMSLGADNVNDIIGAGVVTMASDAVLIPLCLIFIPVVNAVTRMQGAARAMHPAAQRVPGEIAATP